MRYQARYAFLDDGLEYTAIVKSQDSNGWTHQDRFELLAQLRHPEQWGRRGNLDYVEFEEVAE